MGVSRGERRRGVVEAGEVLTLDCVRCETFEFVGVEGEGGEGAVGGDGVEGEAVPGPVKVTVTWNGVSGVEWGRLD